MLSSTLYKKPILVSHFPVMLPDISRPYPQDSMQMLDILHKSPDAGRF